MLDSLSFGFIFYFGIQFALCAAERIMSAGNEYSIVQLSGLRKFTGIKI
tara:strand:+ start:1649 stop:1795 length:147 start_codon:yes stop_codon:yes gene_type:complete